MRPINLILWVGASLLSQGCVDQHALPMPRPATTGSIVTSAGTLTFALYDDAAPQGVANFKRYARAGLYDGGSFYRATRGQPTSHGACCIAIVQGGRLGLEMRGSVERIRAAMAGSPFPPVGLEETAVTGLSNDRGTLAYARLGADTATSEFFVSLENNPILNAGGAGHPDGRGYAVFGRITSGLEILEQLAEAPRSSDAGPFGGQMLAAPLAIVHVGFDDASD